MSREPFLNKLPVLKCPKILQIIFKLYNVFSDIMNSPMSALTAGFFKIFKRIFWKRKHDTNAFFCTTK